MSSRSSSRAIFRDDSTPADKRQAAIRVLMTMCPDVLQVTMRPLVEQAVQQIPDASLDALLLDARNVTALAERGDMDALAVMARKYGASDAQISAYLPGYMPR